MIANLKPYPAMKYSGMTCLGEVPEHWEVSALRRKLRTYDGIKIGPFGSQLKLEQMSPSGYKVYGQANVIARDFSRGTKFVDQEKFNELSACAVLPNDLLVTMMGTSGRCAYVPDDASEGIMDSHLLRLRTDFSINVRFASRIIDESPYVKEQISVTGKGSIMHGLNSGMVKALVLALPPLSEQAAIVRYLDHADRRIRRYIRAKQKLIKLLEEQKQAIINRAVTRGLDPNVRLKPSGVEWLGQVPEHWEIRRLKQICRLAYGDALAAEVRKEGVIPVWGSNGPVGLHSSANTKAPCIVIGRKGSFGKVNYSDDPVFAIDTTFFVDDRFSSAHIRWLFFFLGWLRLDEVTRDSAVPGLDREYAYQKSV